MGEDEGGGCEAAYGGVLDGRCCGSCVCAYDGMEGEWERCMRERPKRTLRVKDRNSNTVTIGSMHD